ncbi:GGDEF domain-containing protein [Peribacillus kribbensis]|uniref:GGDEF domain-containing protein n=1 Tax=Peribacillus kribbensis TaxID=356658 RepID=UPI00047C0ECD|nr:GGDEF domain-containing protein [Peribacillus kribbensis]
MEDLAQRDVLTGLPNRFALQEYLHEITAVKDTFILLYLALDGFKAVNDTLGHRAGDELLKEIGKRLAAWSNPGQFMARLDGDEFVAVISETGKSAREDGLGHAHDIIA